jgi:DNA-binding transcriptional ArsR family regulator
MVLETFEQSGTRTGVITRIARQLGIGTESLRSSVRQAEVDGGLRPGTTTQDKERIEASDYDPVRHDLAPGAVSYHLGALYRAGLVDRTREGLAVRYQLTQQGSWLLEHNHAW